AGESPSPPRLPAGLSRNRADRRRRTFRRRSSGFTVAVGVGLGHRARPMFLDAPLVMYARLAGEVTGQRLSRFGRAFEFDKADEHAGGFGRRQVIDQSLPLSRAQSEPKAHE